jgi:CheY-like chemotaxis protein
MTVLLGTTDIELLSALEFVLGCKGIKSMPVMSRHDLPSQVADTGAEIVVLDVELYGAGTLKVVEQIKDDPGLRGTFLVVFSRSRARLKEACGDSSILNKTDEVVVEFSDGSELIDKIESAAKRLRLEKSQYHRQSLQWKEPYGASFPEERRREERFRLNVPVTIRGKDVLGEPFEEETLMVNASAGGSYLRSEYHMEDNSGLEILVRERDGAGAVFNMRGTIVRTEHSNDRHDLKRRRLAVRFSDDVKQNMEFHLWLARLSTQVDKSSG